MFVTYKNLPDGPTVTVIGGLSFAKGEPVTGIVPPSSICGVSRAASGWTNQQVCIAARNHAHDSLQKVSFSPNCSWRGLNVPPAWPK
jgi:hypothetical protein